MAGVRGIAAKATDEDLAAATAETVLQLVAAANHRVLVVEWGISFDGTVNTNEPVTVELLLQTNAGTSSSLTVQKMNEGDNETLQTTALQDFAAEPTGTTIVAPPVLVHPQGGYTWQAGGFVLPIPIIGGSRLGMRCTAPDAVNCRPYMIFEE